MNLKTRILSLGPIAVLGMALVAAVFIIGNRVEATQRAKLSHAQRILNLIAATEIDFLQARRSEKDFLLREDEKYAARHDEIEARIDTKLSRLEEILNADFDGVMSNEMASLKAAFGLYSIKFEELVAAKRELGLDENSGLQGSLRTSAHNAEEELKKIGNADLTVKMLMMRRHEKDFILRVAEKHVASLAERVAEFKAFPDADFGGPSAKASVVSFIYAYQADFEKFARVTMNERQLRTELSAAFADAEPSFEAIKTFATETNAAMTAAIAEVQKTQLQIAVACLIAAFAAVSLIAYLIARSVSNPLTRTVGTLRALAQGDHRIEVTGEDRKDEIGEMVRAILVFREAARDKERMEREAEENRTLSDRERAERESAKAAEAESLNKAIEAIGNGLVRLSDGDLTVSLDIPLEGQLDRLRTDFNRSVQKLAEALSEVKGTIDNIHGNAGEMRSSVEDLSRRTEQQAASLEETSAALEQITSTVKNSSQLAQEASRKATEANAAGEASTEVVAKAVGAMNRIESASGEIAKIIGVIDEIAFQTNLLALNAGVEAARAGARRRGRQGLRGRCPRGARTGAALGNGGQGNQGPDRQVGCRGPEWCGAGQVDRRGAEQDRGPSGRHQRPYRIDSHRSAGAGDRPSGGQRGGKPDGPGDPAERRHGRRDQCRHPSPRG